MNRNDTGVSTGTGGISILAIFVVLCLTTLAALSLVSARADYALAEKTAMSSVQYYEADAQAEETLAAVVHASSEAGWQEAVRALGCTVEQQDGMALVSYDVEIDNIKNLHVGLSFTLDGNGAPTGEWRRSSWQTQVKELDEAPAGLQVLL